MGRRKWASESWSERQSVKYVNGLREGQHGKAIFRTDDGARWKRGRWMVGRREGEHLLNSFQLTEVFEFQSSLLVLEFDLGEKFNLEGA
jgi:hypothetical protein